MKNMLSRITVIFTVLVFISSCERNIDNTEGVEYNDSDDKNSEYYENSDDYDWDADMATTIVMNGDEVSITGFGATYADGIITIDTLGEYLISGELDDGQILVNAGDDERVKLILNNAVISSSDNSPILVEQSVRTVIILPDNSVNTLSDGATYSTNASNNAAIYSKSDLVLSGNGKLTVNGNYLDGITGKDGLIINSGEYIVKTADDGIRGKDYLVIRAGTFTITSGGDAIVSDNEDSGCGYVDIYDGTFDITSSGDGIYAVNELYIEDGNYDIYCSSGYNSGKALKAGSLITVAGGEYIIQSVDDALHSDLDLLVQAGTFTINTSDDAFHAEDELTIEYADVVIQKCYEGLEAKIITIEDGNITLTASDDGINAASGAGASMATMQPGSSGDNYLYINGGTIVVYASGDGVDVNGSVKMKGGTLLVHGPTSSGNGPLDYDGTFEISGGLLVAAGSSGMAMAPSSSSSQYSVLINFSTTYSAGTLFNLQDNSGNEIVTFKPSKNYQSVAVSSPDIENGTTYKVYTGGSSTGTEYEGLYTDGSYTAGSQYTSFTVSSKTTTVGSSGGGTRPR